MTPKDLLINLGAKHQINSDFDQASSVYMKILKLDPLCASVRYRLGVIAFIAKQYEKSLKLIDTALVLEPHNPIFSFSMAIILKILNRLPEADLVWQRGIQNFNQSQLVDSKNSFLKNKVGIHMDNWDVRLRVVHSIFLDVQVRQNNEKNNDPVYN